MRGNAAALLLCLAVFLGARGSASAQEYILEPGDVVSISFWQQPDLNVQMARIDAEGKINIPLAGRINAAGLTISQLSSKIVERISIYNKSITQATIVINEYGSKRIFVTGAVGVASVIISSNRSVAVRLTNRTRGFVALDRIRILHDDLSHAAPSTISSKSIPIAM